MGFFCMRSIFIIFFNALSSLSFTKLIRLAKLALPHPLFSFISFVATLKAFVIASRLFPETHANNGIGNAFRHALWNCLILSYCCKISSPQKSLLWCEKMTSMHEELFPNQPLEKEMDLHNNEIGRKLFMKMLPGIHRQFFETSFFIDELMKKIKTAKILTKNEGNNADELVYLED